MAQDGLEQLASQIKKYMEFARRILRRWWLIGIFTILGAGGSIAVALSMTRIYQSRTLISWQESVKESMVSGEDVRREHNWLHTRLQETFSSNTLRMQIIKDQNLFPSMRDVVAPEVIVKEFEDKVSFGIVGSDSFWISFDYKNPRLAQKVTAQLANEFIKKNLSDSLSAAQTTLTFMEKEVKKTKTVMDRIENNLAQFVSDHPEYQIDPATGMSRGVTPTPGLPRGRTISYRNVSSPELKQALARKGKLQAQLQLMMSPQSNTKLTQARQDLDRARRRMTSLRQKYTDRHPDVQRSRQYMRQMQVRFKFAMDAASASTGSASRVKQEISTLDQTIAKLSQVKRVAVPKKKPVAVPKKKLPTLSQKASLEKRWYELTRDREVAKAKYDQLQTRLLRTRVAASLERNKAKNQFTVVDKANLPQKPIRPSRTKLAIAGTFLGIMLGFGLAVLLVIFDPRIYSEGDLARACDLPVLAQIPRDP